MAEVLGIYLTSALVAGWLIGAARKNARNGLRDKRMRVVYGCPGPEDGLTSAARVQTITIPVVRTT